MVGCSLCVFKQAKMLKEHSPQGPLCNPQITCDRTFRSIKRKDIEDEGAVSKLMGDWEKIKMVHCIK